MSDIRVRGRCARGDFLRHLLPSITRGNTQMDLSAMTFCDPLGLVGLACIAERALIRNHRVVLRAPRRTEVARYLSRMHVGSVLEALGVEHDLPAVRERDRGDSLVELTRFEGSRGAGQLARLVHGSVEPLDLAAAAALHDGVSEAGENVVRHAHRRRGFVAAQKWYGGAQLHFAVDDSGVGVRRTLSPFGARTDAGALEMALRRGVTETPGDSGGVGLSDVLAHVSSLGGSLHLVSGTAALTGR